MFCPTADGSPRLLFAGYRQGRDPSTGFRLAQPGSSVQASCKSIRTMWRTKPPDAEFATCPAFLAGLGPESRKCGRMPHGLPRCFYGVRCTRLLDGIFVVSTFTSKHMLLVLKDPTLHGIKLTLLLSSRNRSRIGSRILAAGGQFLRQPSRYRRNLPTICWRPLFPPVSQP
jgi:hypothetical protein